MKYFITVLIIACSFLAFADGVFHMQLENMMPGVEVIIEAEIIDNKTSEEQHKEKGVVKSVTANVDVKFKVISFLHGRDLYERIYKRPDVKEMEFHYEEHAIEGIWEASTGSGLEGKFKKGDKCIVLLDGSCQLLRMEKPENKDLILKYFKKKRRRDQ